jgi:hypothetical protein
MEVRGLAECAGFLGHGNFRPNLISVSISTQLPETTTVVLVDNLANVTITLPEATAQRLVFIKKQRTGTGSITVRPAGTGLIDGATSRTLNSNNRGYLVLVADGQDWWVLGSG